MAISQQQKVDFLLKKIGYTKTKTGNATDATGLNGSLTPKAGFAEAIPSPLIIAETSLWTESALIPTTPPGSDTSQVKVYAPAGAVRMTVDSTVANNRAFIAYSTYNNTSSARLTNWIDTQFGSSYIIQVFVNDATNSANKLTASGSTGNNGWFFDYSAGVLNFNDTDVPTSVSSTNVYIVGYRYIGNTGAPTPGDNFSFQDLTVTRNLSVTGLSTFTGLVDINGGGQANTFKVEDLTDNRIVIAGTGGELEDSGNLTFDGTTLGLTGNQTISNQLTDTGAIDANGDLDVDGHTNLDNVSIAGFSTFSDTVRIVDSKSLLIGNNVNGDLQLYHDTNNSVIKNITGDLYINANNSQTGIVLVGSTGAVTLRHGNNLKFETLTDGARVTGKLITTGDLDVDGHTNLDNVSIAGVVTATTFVGNGDFVELDVDGHTNLDNVSVAGVTTFTGTAEFDGTAKFDSTITAGGATGSNGQYLKATGSGVAWASFPTLRTTNVQTATAGQTTFSFSYNASFLDVFVNGTKLTPSEYTASNGTSIVLDIGCFVGDIVEFYSYQTTPGAGGGIPDVVSDTSPELGGTLDLNGNTISGTGHINVTGNLKVSGMTTTAAISLGGHIIPTVHNTYDIGNASFKIRDIYEQNGSDERIKEDIVPFTGGLDFVNQIPVVSFTFKDIDYNEYTRGKRETGFIAQDIKRALDNSTYESYRLWSENPDSYQGLDKKQLIPALVSAIQELTARVEELENK